MVSARTRRAAARGDDEDTVLLSVAPALPAGSSRLLTVREVADCASPANALAAPVTIPFRFDEGPGAVIEHGDIWAFLRGLLRGGTNVLAIVLLNDALGGWDATLNPELALTGGYCADLAALATPAPDACLRLRTLHSDETTARGLAESPAERPGRLYWYLVTGINALGEGPAGNGSAGPRQLDSRGECP